MDYNPSICLLPLAQKGYIGDKYCPGVMRQEHNGQFLTVYCSLKHNYIAEEARSYLLLPNFPYAHPFLGIGRLGGPKDHYHMTVVEPRDIGLSLEEILDKGYQGSLVPLAKKLLHAVDFLHQHDTTIGEGNNSEDIFYHQAEDRLTFHRFECGDMYPKPELKQAVRAWVVGWIYQIYCGEFLEIWDGNETEVLRVLLEKDKDKDRELFDLLLGFL